MANFFRFGARWLRVIVWVCTGVLTLLVLLTVGAVMYTRTAHFQQFLQAELVSVLRGMLDAEVEIGAVKGSIWREIEVDHVSIRKDGLEVVSLPRGVVTVPMWGQLVSMLRTDTFQVANVTLTNPVIRAVQDAQSEWNVLHLFKPLDPSSAQQTEPSRLTIRFPHLAIEGGQIVAHLADGKEMQMTELTLDSALTLAPTGMQAQVRDLHFTATGADAPPLEWRSQLVYEEKNGIRKVTLQPLDLRTALSRVQLAGTVDNLSAPTLALTATIDKLAAADVNAFAPSPYLQEDLSGSVQLTGPLTALAVNTALAAPDGRVSAAVTANVMTSPPELQGSAQLEHVVLQKVVHVVGAEVAGEVQGQVQFQGTDPQKLQAEGSAFVSGLVANGKSIGDVNLTAAVAERKARVFSKINGKSGYVYAQGEVSFVEPLTYDATIMLRNLNAQTLVNDKKTPATNVNVNVSAKGYGTNLETMATEGKITFARSNIGPTVITSGEFFGALRDGQLTLEKGTLLANDATVDMKGRIGGLQKTAAGRLAYHVQMKNLSPWLALAGLTGKGAIELTGAANGALTALYVDGKLSVANIEIGSTAVRGGALSYQFAEIGAPQLRGHVTADAKGVHAGKPLDAVHVDLTLSGSRPVVAQAEVRVDEEASRLHQLSTRIQYAPEQLDVLIQSLALQLPTGTWRASQQPHLVQRGNTWTIDHFVLMHGRQTVSAAGVFTSRGEVKGQLQVEHFALEDLRPFLGDGPTVKGEVNIDVAVQGAATSPDLTANVATGPLIVAEQTYAGLTVQGAYHHERLALTAALQQDQVHALHIEGEMPLALHSEQSGAPVAGEANIHVHSDGLSLAFLELLSKEVKDVQGVADVDVVLRGPVTSLTPAGVVRLQQGNVLVKKLGQTFSDINIDLQLGPTQMRLAQFVMRGGKGQITGTGTIGMSDYEINDFALAFTAQHFRVIDTKEYRAALDGHLSCSGSLQAPVVQGALTVQDVTVRPNLQVMKSGPAPPDPTITIVRQTEEGARGETEQIESAVRKKAEENSPATGGFYEKLTLDVGVVIPPNTWVQMSEGSIELMGDVRVRKEPAQELTLSGTVETVRGWVAVHSRKFQLEKGAIVFTGATPIDPTFDIVAKYVVSEYTVRVSIGGTKSTPTITLTSEPNLEQADILSLLVFGKPANSLSNKEKTSLQSQALQTAVGAVASDFRQAVAEQLGVENFELDVGEKPGQSKVGIGKYVAPGVFVSTSQELGGGTQGQGRDVTIEYQLSDNWQLKASTTARGNNGVDIMWKKKY